ncbi:hypothetical protein XENE109146_15810 [Xenorhabdus nematophila]
MLKFQVILLLIRFLYLLFKYNHYNKMNYSFILKEYMKLHNIKDQ